MKWLKKLLGFGELTPTPAPTAAPADAGAKAFESMAKTLSALEEKKAAAQGNVEEVVEQVEPKAPRKPRAKKEPVAPLPQTVSQNVEQWPFPNDKPAEGVQKPKPAARSVKAK